MPQTSEKQNSLKLYQVKSKVEPFNINLLEDALGIFNSTGFAVAYLDYKVLIGKVNIKNIEFYNNEVIEEEKYIQRIRLFNDDKELLIWRVKNGFKSRLRIDNEGSNEFVVDACQVLWGTNKEKLNNGWIKIYEDRGTELILPYGEDAKIDDKENRLFIMTRNYIGFHPKTYQATYVDCRFVKFTNSPL